MLYLKVQTILIINNDFLLKKKRRSFVSNVDATSMSDEHLPQSSLGFFNIFILVFSIFSIEKSYDYSCSTK